MPPPETEPAAARRFARLAELCARPERTILGLMSGTSLDGLDLALCRIGGHGAATRLELIEFATRPYSSADRERIRAVAALESVSLRALTELHGWLAEWHGRAILEQLGAWGRQPAEVDCIASHGQTIYHAPGGTPFPGGAGHTTLQLGDGDRLAVRTGILTLSDFRQKEIAAGGQGAPLAPYAEALLFAEPGRSRVLLNLGGIANFTWLPPEEPGQRWVSADTGPGNTLIDLAVRRYFPDQPDGFDRDGALAAMGQPHRGLLRMLMGHPYFEQPAPKSTGPELFGEAYLDEALAAANAQALAPWNIVATLTRLSAETIGITLRREVPDLRGAEVVLSGGGALNPALVEMIDEALPGTTLSGSAALGIPPEAKEAVLFAVLANEALAGNGFAAHGARGHAPAHSFGKLSFPD